MKKSIIKIVTCMFIGIFFLPALTTFAAETDAQKIKRLERELTDLKTKIGTIGDMEGAPLKELKTIAGIIWPPTRGLTIDLSARTGEHCLRDPMSGNFMVHFSDHPKETTEDIIYFIAAETFESTGMNLSKLPDLPGLGKMKPGVWYFYDGNGVEPHHGGSIGKPYLVVALDIK